MDEQNQKHWWLVITKSRQDELAESNLVNQGYEIYRPMARRLRKFRGKMKPRIESLFPGYIFIHLDELNDNWHPIRSTYGVNKLLTFGNKPARVPDVIIDTLKREEKKLAEKAIDLDRYKKGETVIVTQEGPYKGMQGIFYAYEGEERVQILLNILHQEAKLSISPGEISSVG